MLKLEIELGTLSWRTAGEQWGWEEEKTDTGVREMRSRSHGTRRMLEGSASATLPKE